MDESDGQRGSRKMLCSDAVSGSMIGRITGNGAAPAIHGTAPIRCTSCICLIGVLVPHTT